MLEIKQLIHDYFQKVCGLIHSIAIIFSHESTSNKPYFSEYFFEYFSINSYWKLVGSIN